MLGMMERNGRQQGIANLAIRHVNVCHYVFGCRDVYCVYLKEKPTILASSILDLANLYEKYKPNTEYPTMESSFGSGCRIRIKHKHQQNWQRYFETTKRKNNGRENETTTTTRRKEKVTKNSQRKSGTMHSCDRTDNVEKTTLNDVYRCAILSIGFS